MLRHLLDRRAHQGDTGQKLIKFQIPHVREACLSLRKHVTADGGENVEERALTRCWWEGRVVHPLCPSVRRLLQTLKVELAEAPATRLLTYPADAKPACQRKTCTPVFAAALLGLAKAQNQLRQPSPGEWIRNAESLHTKRSFIRP